MGPRLGEGRKCCPCPVCSQFVGGLQGSCGHSDLLRQSLLFVAPFMAADLDPYKPARPQGGWPRATTFIHPRARCTRVADAVTPVIHFSERDGTNTKLRDMPFASKDSVSIGSHLRIITIITTVITITIAIL